MELAELQSLLQKYRQGMATPEETQLVEAWFLQTEQEDVVLPETEAALIEARILGRLRTSLFPERTARLPLRRPAAFFIRVAAMLVVIAGAGVMAYLYRNNWLQYVDPVKTTTVQSGPYEVKRVWLPDSTLVALYHNSTLTYPQRYRDTREVMLTGQGYFDVSRRSGQPFIVHTGHININVLGTSFVVTDVPEDSTAAVSVLTGKVSVSREQYTLATLTPSKTIRYNKTRQTSTLDDIDATGLITWIDKQLVFKTTPLQDVFHAVATQYHLSIQVKENITNGKVFTGEFTAKDSLRDVLDIIAVSTGLNYQQLRDSTIIITK